MERIDSVSVSSFLAADDGAETIELSYATFVVGGTKLGRINLSPVMARELYDQLTPIIRGMELDEMVDRTNPATMEGIDY